MWQKYTILKVIFFFWIMISGNTLFARFEILYEHYQSESSVGECDGEIGLWISGTAGPFTYQLIDHETGDLVLEEAIPMDFFRHVLDGLCGGEYRILVNTKYGCEQELGPFEIETCTEPQQLEFEITNTCDSDGSVTIITPDHPSDLIYAWDNGISGGTLEGLSQGEYCVTATDVAGCLAYSGCAVVESAEANITLSLTAMQNVTTYEGSDGSLSISASPVGNYTYEWSNGATSTSLSGLAAGNYTVTVYEGEGCSMEQTFEVGSCQYQSTAGSGPPQIEDVPPFEIKMIYNRDDNGNYTLQVAVKDFFDSDFSVANANNYDIEWTNMSGNQILGTGSTIQIPTTYTGDFVNVRVKNGCHTIEERAVLLNCENTNPGFLADYFIKDIEQPCGGTFGSATFEFPLFDPNSDITISNEDGLVFPHFISADGSTVFGGISELNTGEHCVDIKIDDCTYNVCFQVEGTPVDQRFIRYDRDEATCYYEEFCGDTQLTSTNPNGLQRYPSTFRDIGGCEVEIYCGNRLMRTDKVKPEITTNYEFLSRARAAFPEGHPQLDIIEGIANDESRFCNLVRYCPLDFTRIWWTSPVRSCRPSVSEADSEGCHTLTCPCFNFFPFTSASLTFHEVCSPEIEFSGHGGFELDLRLNVNIDGDITFDDTDEITENNCTQREIRAYQAIQLIESGGIDESHNSLFDYIHEFYLNNAGNEKDISRRCDKIKYCETAAGEYYVLENTRENCLSFIEHPIYEEENCIIQVPQNDNTSANFLQCQNPTTGEVTMHQLNLSQLPSLNEENNGNFVIQEEQTQKGNSNSKNIISNTGLSKTFTSVTSPETLASFGKISFEDIVTPKGVVNRNEINHFYNYSHERETIELDNASTLIEVVDDWEKNQTIEIYSVLDNREYSILLLDITRNWSKTISADNALSVAHLSKTDDRIFIAGRTFGNVIYDAQTIFSANNETVFVLQLDLDGNFISIQSIGSIDIEQEIAISEQINGRIIISGGYNGDLQVNGQTTNTSGNRGIFVAQYANGGVNLVADLQSNGTYDIRGVAVSADSSSVALAFNHIGNVSLQNSVIYDDAQSNLLLLYLNMDGSMQNIDAIPSANLNLDKFAINNGDNQDFYVGLTFTNSIDLFGEEIISEGEEDVLLLKYGAGGVSIGKKHIATATNENVSQLLYNNGVLFFGGEIVGNGGYSERKIGEYSFIDFNSDVQKAYISFIYDELCYPEEVASNDTRTEDEFVAALNNLTTEDKVEAGANTKYVAGESVRMKPGFHAKAGSNMHAFIDGQSDIRDNEDRPYFEDCVEGESLQAIDDRSDEAAESIRIAESTLRAYPNPFTNATTIEYQLPVVAPVTLHIYNMQGEQIAQLVDGQEQVEGKYQVEVDATAYPAGIYYVTLRAGERILTEKLIVVK